MSLIEAGYLPDYKEIIAPEAIQQPIVEQPLPVPALLLPEVIVDPDSLTSKKAIVDAALEYQEAAASYLKENGSDGRIHLRDALARVVGGVPTDRLSTISDPLGQNGKKLSGEMDSEKATHIFSARNSALSIFEAHAVRLYPERFSKPTVSMERGQTYDVDSSPTKLPLNTSKIPADAPRRFRK